jgi:serine/threonine-protein phosphatase PGAM5
MARTQLYLVRHGEAEPHDGDLSARVGRRLRKVPFSVIHHSPLARAAIIAGDRPRHACDRIADRTPAPSPAQRSGYPQRWHSWLDESQRTNATRTRPPCARRSTTSASSATTTGPSC